MKTKIALLLFLSSICCSTFAQLPEGFPSTSRQKFRINQDWKFNLENSPEAKVEYQNADNNWKQVQIPHTLELSDLNLNDCTDDPYQLTFQRFVGYYKKEMFIQVDPSERVFLEFEGVHQVTNLWVNGQHVGEHSVGGYTPFHFDITEFVINGKENEFLISADNRPNENVPPDGDQYDYIKWGGLYRDVYLVTTHAVHVTFPWEELNAGVTITTPTVTPDDATISVKTNVRNTEQNDQIVQVITRVIDAKGQVVLKMKKEQVIGAGQTYTFQQTGGLQENVQLWSPEHPYLYRVNSLLKINGQDIDVVENPLGLRTLEFIAGTGFLINGQNTELIGANRHQAYPFMGDAVPNSLHWKDAWQFKQCGFNMVRLAHYPHDNSFIEACDQLGIMIFEEPPSWIGIGGEIWFDNLEEATRRMVRNHRNHPSIIMWGAAINHRGPVERLHYACKEEDPKRVTASNGSPWTGPRFSGVTDIYTPMDYQNMPIVDDDISFLCEHGSSGDAARQQYEVSKSRQSKNRIGVAVWTAHDYQAFKPNRKMAPRRNWTWHRVPNEPYYWYQSELLEAPVIHIASNQVTEKNKVLVFSNCSEVILSHNGAEIGRQYPDQHEDRRHLLHPPFTFDFDWRNGEIEVKGIRNGEIATSQKKRIARRPNHLSLSYESDGRDFLANGSDIKLVRAIVMDENNSIVETTDSWIEFEVTGAGHLIGASLKDANPSLAHNGIATAYIQCSNVPGPIEIRAKSAGLGEQRIQIETVADNENRTIAEAEPIYDFPVAKIDMGGPEQFVQFDWMPWSRDSLDEAVFYPKEFPNAQISISATNDSLEWLTSWGQSSKLAYLSMDGVKTSSTSELKMTLSDFPSGNYQITSFHHIRSEFNKPSSSLSLIVNDALGVRNVFEGFKPTQGSYLFNMAPVSKSYPITFKSGKEVTITLHDTKRKIPLHWNGLIIRKMK